VRGTRLAALAAALLLARPLVPARAAPPDPAAGLPAPAPERSGPAPSSALPPRWTLDDVVRIALENHPRVGRFEAEERAARARQGQARSALYPSVTLSSGAARSRAFSSSARGAVVTENDFGQGAVSQVLADFGRTAGEIRRAEALRAAAGASAEGARRDVAFLARTAFFDVLRARALLAVREQALAQRESLLRQAQAYYEAGIRARIDVARAEANLYQARAELVAAQNDLRIARIALLDRMGLDGPADYELVEPGAAEPPPGDLEEWARLAAERRPELRELAERERAAESALRAARAGHAPVLAASGSYGYAGEDFPWRQTYSLSLTATLPLFSGFAVEERVAEAQAARDAAAYALAEARRRVRLEVEEAALRLAEAGERLEARKRERDAFAENLRLAAGRYEAGAGDIIEMIDAQVQMARSEADTVEARYDHALAVAALLRAAGL